MRVVNRALAVILALAIIAVCVIVIAEVIAHALNHQHVIVDWPAWQRWAERTHWNRAVIKVWSIILIVIGILLLAPQLKRRRVTRLPLETDDPALDPAVTRGGVAAAVSAAAQDVDGVQSTRTAVTRRRVRITARTRAAARWRRMRCGSLSAPPRRSVSASSACAMNQPWTSAC